MSKKWYWYAENKDSEKDLRIEVKIIPQGVDWRLTLQYERNADRYATFELTMLEFEEAKNFATRFIGEMQWRIMHLN